MKYLKLGIVVFAVFVLIGVFFGCKKSGKRGTDESELKAAETKAPQPDHGEEEYGYKDFYLGMSEAELKTGFDDEVTSEGAGRYTYRGYPEREVRLVYSAVSGDQYLTAINVRFSERDDDEELIEELIDIYGMSEYDSHWIPANDDHNSSDTPSRQVIWPGKVDIILRLSASRDFDEFNKEGVKFKGELWVEDGREQSDPHNWVSKKLGASEKEG